MNVRISWSLVTTLALLFTGLVSACFFAYRYKNLTIMSSKIIEQSAHDELVRVEVPLNEYFFKLEQATNTIGGYLSTHKLAPDELDMYAKKTLAAQNELHALVVAYKPETFGTEKKLNAFVYMRDNAGSIVHLSLAYDYTKPTAPGHDSWYLKTLAQGSGWTQPYWEPTLNERVLGYAKSFGSGVVVGLSRLAKLRTLVESLSVGQSGYGFVISSTGTFVAHPRKEYYVEGQTIGDLALESKNRDLWNLATRMLNSAIGKGAYQDEASGKTIKVMYKHLTSAPLILACALIPNEVLTPWANTFRRYDILLISAILLALLALLYLIARACTSKQRALIICANASIVLITAGIAYLWRIERMQPHALEEEKVQVFDDTAVGAIAQKTQANLPPNTPLIKIKTGILLTCVRDSAQSVVTINAYVWQRYPIKSPIPLVHDILLPQCARIDSKELVYQTKNDQEEIYTWLISAQLNQPLHDANLYPLDTRNIAIELGYPTYDPRIILVPDFVGYDLINPTALPGLNDNLEVADWNIVKSFFSYKPFIDKASLGTDNQANLYTLNFNIDMRRYLLSVIVTYLLQVLVALGLLLITLLTTTRENIVQSIASTAAVFLGIVVAHTSLRTYVDEPRVVYLEYFFIALYACIALVLSILFMHTRKQSKKTAPTSDIFALKILLVPTYLASMYVLTAVRLFMV